MWDFVHNALKIPRLNNDTTTVVVLGEDGSVRLRDVTTLNSDPLTLADKYPAVAAAIDLRTEALAEIPLLVQPADPVLQAALEALNLYDSLGQTELDLIQRGNAYWRIVTVGSVFSIIVLRASAMEIGRNGEYKYEGVVIPPEQIIHFRERRGGRYTGTSPLISLRESVEVGLWERRGRVVSAKAFQAVGRAIVGVDARPGRDGRPTMTDADMTKIGNWANNTDGEAKAAITVRGNPSIQVLGGHDNPTFVENQTWVIQEVARSLRVPAVLLEELSRATYNNIDAIIAHWYARVIESRMRLFEETINQALRMNTNLRGRVVFDRSELPSLDDALDDGIEDAPDDNEPEDDDE